MNGPGQKKYVPPNRRDSYAVNKKQCNKKQCNKSTQHFNMQSTFEFPELGAVVSKFEENDNNMNYAIATKEEEEETNTICPNSVAPGWVRLRRSANGEGPIQREYGDGTATTKTAHGEQEQRTNWGLTTSQSIELNRLVNRWQTDRDIANDYLDQSSPYWGMKHIDDPLSDDDLESEKGSGFSDEDENSEGMDDEYGDYY